MKGYKLTTEKFIEKAKIIHSNKYDYSKVNYISSKENVVIICQHHGVFSQRANNHLLGVGCKKCTQKIPINKKITNVDFINKAILVHGNKYDYSLVEYTNSHNKIKIKCENNHIFEQRPDQHLNGHGCKFCVDRFRKKASVIHNNLYDYSLVEYKNNSSKVNIICKKHGIFEQRVSSHLFLKRGCPNCKTSKNELLISKILNDNKIKFEPQKTFEDCKYKYKLSFDFYLIDLNICIEYDGKQHYENIYNCDVEFKNIQIRDKIKNTFCEDNNIKLLRIKYTENTENMIKLFLKNINTS